MATPSPRSTTADASAELLLPEYRNRRERRNRRSKAETTILDVTERLLQTTPLHELEIKHILTEAGLSRTAFYVYFSSKFDVVAALLSRSFQDIADAMGIWLDGDEADSEKRLLGGFRAAGEAWKTHRAILCSASESWHLDADLETLYVGFIDQFVGLTLEIVEREQESGRSILRGDPVPVVNALVWGTERVFYLALSGKRPDSLPDVEAAITASYPIWYAAIYGESPPPASEAS